MLMIEGIGQYERSKIAHQQVPKESSEETKSLPEASEIADFPEHKKPPRTSFTAMSPRLDNKYQSASDLIRRSVNALSSKKMRPKTTFELPRDKSIDHIIHRNSNEIELLQETIRMSAQYSILAKNEQLEEENRRLNETL